MINSIQLFDHDIHPVINKEFFSGNSEAKASKLLEIAKKCSTLFIVICLAGLNL